MALDRKLMRHVFVRLEEPAPDAARVAELLDLYYDGLIAAVGGQNGIAVGEIKGIIGQLRARDIGVLITDHNVRETLDICDRAYIISEGRVIAAGPPSALLQDAQVRAVYLGEHFRL